MKKRQTVLVRGDVGGAALGRVIGIQKRTGLVHVKFWMGGTYLVSRDRLEVR